MPAKSFPKGKFGSVYDVDNLGTRLHDLRIQKSLTLDELAKKSGVPISTISKIERNKIKPSFTNAIDLAMALEKNLGFLVRKHREGTKLRSIVRKGGGPIMRFREIGVSITDITGSFLPGILEARLATVNAGVHSGTQFMHHPGEEICHVIAGTLEFYVATNHFILEKGDTIHFDCIIPHRWQNSGKSSVTMLSIFSKGLSF